MKHITPVAHTRPNPLFLQERELPSDLDRFKNDSENTFIENLIEYSGRLCYHSTAKMGKAPNFIAARVREGHEDIIEHASATVHIVDKDPNSGPPIIDHLVWRNLNRHCESSYTGGNGYFVTANLRVWLDFFRRGYLLEAIPYLRSIAPKVFAEFDSEEKRKARAEEMARMGGPNPFVGVDPDPEEIEMRQANEGPRFGIEPHEIRDSRVTLLAYTQPEPSAPYIHSSATFLIEGVSRAFTHQLVRHRLGSFSQESQRYCEFGDFESDLPPRVPHLVKAKDNKRHGHCLFSVNQEKFIVSQYKAGFNCEEIGQAYGVHGTTIRDIVLHYGESMRSTTESKLISVKTDFFKQIDTPLKAQILGLIYADGNVAQRKGEISFATITQHSDYAAWLKRIGKLWGGNVVSGGHENSRRLIIPGKKMAEDLVRHGVVPAKSKILEPPNLTGELARHFIRGYIEGDGHIGTVDRPANITVVGTKNLLAWMQTEICNQVGFEPKQSIRKMTGCHSLTFGGKNLTPKILEWLYNGFDFRYSHPAKLKRSSEWCHPIRDEFQRQIKKWGQDMEMVIPPKLTPVTFSIWMDAIESSAQGYANLRSLRIRKEDARFLLPNAAKSRIVVTMNFEAWSHFVWLRAVDKAAQWEIRRVGQAILQDLYFIAPAFFAEHWEKYNEDRHVGHHANVT